MTSDAERSTGNRPRSRARYIIGAFVVPLLALSVVTILALTVYISISLAGSSELAWSISLGGFTLFLLALEIMLGGVAISFVYWMTTGSRPSLVGAFTRLGGLLGASRQNRSRILALSVVPLALLVLAAIGSSAIVGQIGLLALGTKPSPLITVALLIGEVIIIAGSAFLLYMLVAYIHWIITNRWIRSWRDLWNWSREDQ